MHRRDIAEAIGTLVLAAIAVLGVLSIAYKAGLPVLLTRENGRLEAGAPRAGAHPRELRRHDVVTDVGGIPVETPEAAELVLDGYEPGAPVAIGIERDGHPALVTETLVRWYGPFYLASLAFTAALYFALGAIVRRRRPHDAAARAFSGAAISIAIMITTSWGSRVLPFAGLGALLMPINGTAYALTAALSITFMLLFPRPRVEWTRELGLALAGIAAVLAAWRGVAYVRFTRDPAGSIAAFLLAFDVARVFLLASVVGALGIFVHGFVRTTARAERRQFAVVLLGLAIAIPGFLLLWQIPTLLGRPGLVPEAAIQLLVSIIPITFAISMVHHHLMDVDVLVSRSGAYAIAAGSVLLVYLALVAVAAAVAGERVHWHGSGVGPAITAIVIALLFEPVRARLQRVIDRVFFRARYDLRRAEDALAATVRDALGPVPLAETLLAQLDLLLPAEGWVLVSTAASERGATVLARRGSLAIEPELALRCVPAGGIAALPERVEPGIVLDDEPPAPLRRAGATLALALPGSGGRRQGALLAGARRSGTRYTREDLDLAAFAARETGSALERFALQQEVLLQHAESARLAELNRVHSLFVSGISHDMRTPLASIRMFAELLAARIPVADREYVGIIEGEASRLERLIENVLEYARIERQAKVYRPEPCELNALVRETLRSLRYLFRVHRVTVRVALAHEPIVVAADPRALVAALTNLATNAVKYSIDTRRVTFRVRREGPEAAIEVADRGIGIPEADLPHVFEAFYRSSEPAVREIGGAGLGLMVVQHAMEAHGGRATVASAPGRGSTFTLRLPLAASVEDDVDAESPGRRR